MSAHSATILHLQVSARSAWSKCSPQIWPACRISRHNSCLRNTTDVPPHHNAAMPRYRSTGLEAMLYLTNLQESLSEDLPMSSGMMRPERVQEALGAGSKMWEYPIGADGSESGVYQSIGEHEDMPLFVVEVQAERRRRACPDPHQESESEPEADVEQPGWERLSSSNAASPTTESTVAAAASASKAAAGPPAFVAPTASPANPALPARPPIVLRLNNRNAPSKRSTNNSMASSLSSPLSTLGATPPSLKPAQSLFAAQPDSSLHSQDSPLVFHRPAQKTLPSAYSIVPHTNHKALVLTIDTSLESFPNRKPISGPKATSDMKIEVFLNGSLDHIHYINRQRSGAFHKLHFAGIRIDRQTEKPWVYQSTEDAGPSALTAQQRWNCVSELLAGQVDHRGVNSYRSPPPTAEYLRALSQMAFPDRLEEKNNLGILDVVITTGKGRKLSSHYGFETCPVPMRSAWFKFRIGTDGDLIAGSLDDGAVADPRYKENKSQAEPMNTDDTDSGHTSRSSSETPSKRAKHTPAPSRVNTIAPTGRRVSRRLAGELSDLAPDHFLKIPGQVEPAPALPPVQTARDVGESSPLSSLDDTEMTSSEAADVFETPEMCKGCVLSYHGSGTQRQIKKEQRGEFEENAFVVGFRFVVV